MRAGIRKSFWLQASLILLPVVILAVVGLVMVQRDRESVIQEARESSERIVPTVADHLGKLLIDRMQADLLDILQADWQLRTMMTSGTGNRTIDSQYFGEPFGVPAGPLKALMDAQSNSSRGHLFDGSFGWILLVDQNGQSIFPPPYSDIPIPQHPPEPLAAPVVEELETKLEAALSELDADTSFSFESDPPLSSPEGRHLFDLAAQHATKGNSMEALALYQWLASRTETLKTQSGLPVQVLSAFSAVELLQSENLPWDDDAVERKWIRAVDELEESVIAHPSCISVTILEQIYSDQPDKLIPLLDTWATLNSTLDFSRELAESLNGTRLSRENLESRWLRWRNMDWWVGFTPLMKDAQDGFVENVFATYPFSRLSMELAALELIEASGAVLPPGVGVRVEVDGVPVVDLHPAAQVLATHSAEIMAGGYRRYKNFDRYFEERGVGRVTVSFVIAEPNVLLAMQRQRSFWLFGIIAGAMLVSFAGLVLLWTTHNRQLALNAMKTNFVSSVSHELRAPIASVRLMAENLQHGKVKGEEKVNEYIGFIGQECRRLSSLIENVLDFSRIEQGRMSYQFEPTDLVQLVQDTVRLMQPYADERKVGLTLEINAQPQETEGRDSCRPVPSSSNSDAEEASRFEVTVDARAIQQALINLIDNAIKHSPAGESVEVCLQGRTGILPVSDESNNATSTQSTPSRHDRNKTGRMPVLLSVKDHGPGIPESEQQKIFERFYRRGSELRRETQGIGIGLSIVQHIVEGHGGRVWVESEPGNGSKFVVELKRSTNRE